MLFLSAAVIPSMASDLENGNDSDGIKLIRSADDSNDALVTGGVSNEKRNMDQTTAMDVDNKNIDPGTEFSFLVTQCRIAVGDLNLSQELIETGVAINDLDMVKNELKDLNKCMDDFNTPHIKLIDLSSQQT